MYFLSYVDEKMSKLFFTDNYTCGIMWRGNDTNSQGARIYVRTLLLY